VQCPLVLQVRVAWTQGKALGSEEDRRKGCGLLGECSRGKKLSIWGVSFMLGGQHNDEIMIMVGTLHGNHSVQREFGYLF
jgi:hypothetical protein